MPSQSSSEFFCTVSIVNNHGPEVFTVCDIFNFNIFDFTVWMVFGSACISFRDSGADCVLYFVSSLLGLVVVIP